VPHSDINLYFGDEKLESRGYRKIEDYGLQCQDRLTLVVGKSSGITSVNFSQALELYEEQCSAHLSTTVSTMQSISQCKELTAGSSTLESLQLRTRALLVLYNRAQVLQSILCDGFRRSEAHMCLLLRNVATKPIHTNPVAAFCSVLHRMLQTVNSAKATETFLTAIRKDLQHQRMRRSFDATKLEGLLDAELKSGGTQIEEAITGTLDMFCQTDVETGNPKIGLAESWTGGLAYVIEAYKDVGRERQLLCENVFAAPVIRWDNLDSRLEKLNNELLEQQALLNAQLKAAQMEMDITGCNNIIREQAAVIEQNCQQQAQARQQFANEPADPRVLSSRTSLLFDTIGGAFDMLKHLDRVGDSDEVETFAAALDAVSHQICSDVQHHSNAVQEQSAAKYLLDTVNTTLRHIPTTNIFGKPRLRSSVKLSDEALSGFGWIFSIAILWSFLELTVVNWGTGSFLDTGKPSVLVNESHNSGEVCNSECGDGKCHSGFCKDPFSVGEGWRFGSERVKLSAKAYPGDFRWWSNPAVGDIRCKDASTHSSLGPFMLIGGMFAQGPTVSLCDNNAVFSYKCKQGGGMGLGLGSSWTRGYSAWSKLPRGSFSIVCAGIDVTSIWNFGAPFHGCGVWDDGKQIGSLHGTPSGGGLMLDMKVGVWGYTCTVEDSYSLHSTNEPNSDDRCYQCDDKRLNTWPFSGVVFSRQVISGSMLLLSVAIMLLKLILCTGGGQDHTNTVHKRSTRVDAWWAFLRFSWQRWRIGSAPNFSGVVRAWCLESWRRLSKQILLTVEVAAVLLFACSYALGQWMSLDWWWKHRFIDFLLFRPILIFFWVKLSR
jgi:hypothetical protein